MPGYQPMKLIQPSEYYGNNEPLYGHAKQIKNKKKVKGTHPLFEDLKTRHTRERMEYERCMRGRGDIARVDPPPPPQYRFDSLNLLGTPNDAYYLNTFMSMPRQRNQKNITDENEARYRPRSITKSSSTVLGKGQRNSVHSESAAVTVAMLSSLRSAASEDNIYESVEMIHYLKTKQTLDRQKKTRSLQKTGHPLFDSLREEQALKGPCRKDSNTKKPVFEQGFRQEYLASDGNSPSQSSSSSGDEYETFSRVVPKTVRVPLQKVMQPVNNKQRRHSEHCVIRQEMPKIQPKKKPSETTGSESDDEWKIIPRPRLVGKIHTQQRRGEVITSLDIPLTGADESDSSFNSTILR